MRGKIGLFVFVVVVLLVGVNVVSGFVENGDGSVTYDPVEIESIVTPDASSTKVFTDLISATKVCEILDPLRPVVVDFGKPYGAQEADASGGNINLRRFDDSVSPKVWKDISSRDGSGCKVKSILRKLTCRSLDTVSGEISRITNTNFDTITVFKDFYGPNGISTAMGYEMVGLKEFCRSEGVRLTSLNLLDMPYIDVRTGSPGTYCDNSNVYYFTDPNWIPRDVRSPPAESNYQLSTLAQGFIECIKAPVCIPDTCDDLPMCAVNLDDGCSGTLNCGLDSDLVNTACLNTSTGDCLNNEAGCNLKCEGGWDNCDTESENWANGCELAVTSDNNNCGGCGIKCNVDAGESCVAGSCFSSAFNLWTDMNENPIVFANLNDYVRLVSDEDPDYTITGDITVDKKYWKADFAGDYTFTSSKPSGKLVVGSEPEDTLLRVKVLQPLCGDFFDVGTSQTIKILMDDPDDLVSGNISVDGTFVRNFNNDDSNTISFDHPFERAGNIPIDVFANNTRGERFKIRVNVMVVDPTVDGSYVAACIDKPSNFERFTESKVFFVASSSQGLEYDSSGASVEDRYNVIDKEKLYFNWKFEFGTDLSLESLKPCSGLGSTGRCPGSNLPIYAFYRNFPTVDNNKVSLSVSIPE